VLDNNGKKIVGSDEETLDSPESRAKVLRWLQWPRQNVFSGAGFESQKYLTKWLFISTAIGLVAGLGAIAFYVSIDWATHFFLGTLAGYAPPSPVGEGSPAIVPVGRPWLLAIVTALGGLISGLIVFSLAPEAEGHGTDAAIEAIHHKWGRISALIPPVKLVASAITIGAGGSGGREGPAAQISAGFGSLLGRWVGLDAQDRRIAVAAGMGAGIGAIFRAPLGGAVMAAEILYLHDLEVEALIPALIASIVGYSVYGAFFGYSPIFGAQPGLSFDNPVQLVYYAALGLLSGLVGILYSRSFYGITGFFHRIKLPRWFKPAIGGLLVGMMGIVMPQALHMGYGWVQIAMTQQLLGLPLWVVLLLPFAKIVATSISIGSGGSGGIFGPGMVIGGMLGASFWRLGHDFLPGMPSSPAPFVIVGMIALFGGIAHAPLAVMLMVGEMTGNLSLLAPAMVAVAISTALVGDNTIYKSQLPNRAASPAHRVRFSFPLLSSLLVRDAMEPGGVSLRDDQTLSVAARFFDTGGMATLPVVNERGDLMGTLARTRIDQVPPGQRDSTTARECMTDKPLTLMPDLTLDVALERMAEKGANWAPVVDGNRLVGQLLTRDIMSTYKNTLQRSVRRASALTAGTVLFEAHLNKTSPLAGRTLRDSQLPSHTLVVSVSRDGETIFPQANTRLQPGDQIMVMADAGSEATLKSFLEGS
jgi:chloride channel protein, CIC family